MLPALKSMLVWLSSFLRIKFMPLVVLFLSNTICSSLDQFPWTWVSNELDSNRRLALSLALVDGILRLDL